jgi:hypothetical protein
MRVPQLKEVKCAEGGRQCTLVGTDLFLLQQVGTDAQRSRRWRFRQRLIQPSRRQVSRLRMHRRRVRPLLHIGRVARQ